MTRAACARMRPLEIRGLTAGEMRLADIVFAGGLDYGRIRVAQLPPVFPGAMVPFGREIVHGSWRAARDFADAPAAEQGWFVHELAHVWQATAGGVVLAAAKLVCLRRADYEVRLAPGRGFGDLNIEAQAEVARFAWHARTGRPLGWPNAAAIAALWPISAPQPPAPPRA